MILHSFEQRVHCLLAEIILTLACGERISKKSCHRGLSCSRIAGEYKVERYGRLFHAVFLAELLDLQKVYEVGDVLLHALETGHGIQFLEKSVHILDGFSPFGSCRLSRSL